jgi:BMFP domain-containing protein YqiC
MKAIGEDLERNFKSLLQSGLGRMDLVTREEFDLQVAVLERTREKLDALEARLAELEDSASE